jgi:hypothetical protein
MPNVNGMTSTHWLGSLQRGNFLFSSGRYKATLLGARVGILTLSLLIPSCFAEEPANTPAPPEASVNNTLPVNWIYGAFIPKDAPIVPLTGEERFKLYLRQTYTTPGIYVKTGFFAIHDQVKETQPGWGDGASGFAKRVGSLQAGNIIQNSLTSLGNAALGFEPRYDRCRCQGAWPRIRHAVVRNFITYGGADDKGIRPQIVSYAAAFGAGVTQAWVGVVIDALAEFAPDIKGMLHKNKSDDK